MAAIHVPLANQIAAKHGIPPAHFRRHLEQSSTPSAQAIDRFITPGSPLARAGGGAMLLRATGGNYAGAALLAAIARKESSFGATAGKYVNNFWGWNVHNGQTFPSVEAGARTVWQGLNGSLYRGSGLTTAAKIFPRYAPPSENDTGLYVQQVNSWLQQQGVNPNANVFSGSGGSAAADAAGVPSSAPAASLSRAVPALDTKRLMMLLNATKQRVLSGQAPGPNYAKQIEMLLSGVGQRAQVNATAQNVGANVQGAATAAATYATPFGTNFRLPALPSEVAPVRATSQVRNPKGQAVPITTFDGKPVSAWWASMLTFARAHGWKGSVNSGYRSVAEQAAIWNRHPDPKWVAHPGSSPHNYGMGVDISDGPGLEAVIKKYGLPIARYAAEGWHFEPLGFRTNGTQKTF